MDGIQLLFAHNFDFKTTGRQAFVIEVRVI